jgi:hypothetical protein
MSKGIEWFNEWLAPKGVVICTAWSVWCVVNYPLKRTDEQYRQIDQFTNAEFYRCEEDLKKNLTPVPNTAPECPRSWALRDQLPLRSGRCLVPPSN